MSKKVLWYVCLGLICLSAFAYVAIGGLATKTTILHSSKIEIEIARIEALDAKGLATAEDLARLEQFRAILSPSLDATMNSAGTPAAVEVQKAKEGVTEEKVVEETVSANATAAPKAPRIEIPASPTHEEAAEFVYSPVKEAFQRYLETGEVSAADKPAIIGMIENNSGRAPRVIRGLDDTGGPDVLGYTFEDNINGGTTPFAWIELCGDPLAIEIPTLDDNSTPINWGFNFPFGTNIYTSGWVNSNGTVNFDFASASLSNVDVSETNTNSTIAGFWDDLDPDGDGPLGTGCLPDPGDQEVWYRDFGTYVVVEWKNVPAYFESVDRYSFQIIFYDDGCVKIQHNTDWDASGDGELSASIHIDPAGPGGLSYLYNGVPAGRLALAGRAILFCPGALPDNDFAATGVIDPAGNVPINTVFTVTGTFQNLGNITQASPVNYTFDGGPVQTENTAALAQFASEDHTFAVQATAPAVPGVYVLDLYSSLPGDENPGNDHLLVDVTVFDPAGDICPDPIDVIPALPYNDIGNTCDYNDDYDAECPYPGSTSPDVAYHYTPPVDQLVTISLCPSSYDTKLYVYDNANVGPGLELYCNDDASPCPGSTGSFRSLLTCVQLSAGVTYCIIVDGYGGACGDYDLTLTECITGRCCYGDPFAPTCGDITNDECLALGGDFDETLDCTTPCEPTCIDPPLNDDCSALTPPVLTELTPLNLTGDNSCATENDCVNFPAVVWESFEITQCQNVTIDFCGSAFDPAPNAYTNLMQDCACASYILADSWDNVPCGDTNWSLYWINLPAGVYYYPIYPDMGPVYTINITAAPCEVGRCCYYDGLPQCADNTLPDCDALGGAWTAGLNCIDNPCPIGRCCYGDPLAPSCADVTEAECGALNGIWDGTLDCTTPCPTCVVDFSVTAPGAWTGNTLGAGDDCTTDIGEDQMYEVVIPNDGLWTFYTCEATYYYDTYLHVTTACCGGTVIAVGDDGCSPNGLQSLINCTEMTAGTYYVWVEGFSSSAGQYTLTVSECTTGRCCYGDPWTPICEDIDEVSCLGLGGVWDGTLDCTTPCPTCTVAPDNDVCADLVDCPTLTEAAPLVLTGNNDCVTPELDCVGEAVVWECFTTTQCQDVELAYCGSEYTNANGYVNIFGDCECGVAFPATPPYDNTSCGDGNYTVNYYNLPAGTWYIAIIPDLGPNYSVTLTASPCGIGRCCYGDPFAPSCDDITEPECTALGGTWTQGSNCTDNPCPIPPDNDLCETAELAAVPSNPTGSTTLASLTPGYPVCEINSPSSPDVWYKILGTGNTVTVSTCGGAVWDTKLIVYCGSCDPALTTCVTSNDDACGGFQSEVSFCTHLNCEYYINVGGYGSATGDFTLAITDDGVPCVPIVDCGPCLPTECDPIEDLTVILDVPNSEIDLNWTVTQDADFKVWSTTNPNHDGDPNGGTDPDFTLEADLGALTVGPASWSTPDVAPTPAYFNFVVSAEGCGPPVPTGRCCYGDPLNPSCTDNITLDDCNALSGTWSYNQNCIDNPCPIQGLGEDCTNPIPVGALPFSYDGSTVGFVDDYDEVCPYSGSLSPDVVFEFTPATTVTATLSLCGGTTDYDTKLYIYENGVTPGLPYACNDDACTAPLFPSAYVSELVGIVFTAGNTYCIVVDGYASASGNYTLTIQ